MQFTLILFPIALAIYGAIIYLFVLLVKALRKYIKSKNVREEKKAVCRSLGEALKAHRTEKQMLLLLEFLFLHNFQIAVIRVFSDKIVHKTTEQPLPAKKLRITADRHACLHGSHGKPGHRPVVPVLFHPVPWKMPEGQELPLLWRSR